MRVTVKSRLPANAEQVWELVKKSHTTAYVCKGMIGYKNAADWPEEWVAGNTVDTELLLLGKLNLGAHQINIVARDEQAKTIHTEESSASIKRWDHEMRVSNGNNQHCCYQDSIEIDAGLLTPVIVAYANIYYRYRHRRWLKLLASETNRVH